MPASSNAFELAAEFEARGPIVTARAISATRHYAMLLETSIKAHASGRPGPNVITGNYRRSWSTTFGGGFSGAFSATVGTNAPQGPRLEFGFIGTDSLGRTYSQSPYPHAGPAASEVLPQYETAMGELLTMG